MLVWTFLNHRDCARGDFGEAAAVCDTLLQQPRGKAVNLAALPELGTLLASRDTEPRDCAEFTAEFFEWNTSPIVDMSWERRVSMTTGVVCEELRGKCQPVALDGLYELDLSYPTITDLCHMWTYGHGMRAAFTQHQSIKCVFADRLMTPTRHLGHFKPIEVNKLAELP